MATESVTKIHLKTVNDIATDIINYIEKLADKGGVQTIGTIIPFLIELVENQPYTEIKYPLFGSSKKAIVKQVLKQLSFIDIPDAQKEAFIDNICDSLIDSIVSLAKSPSFKKYVKKTKRSIMRCCLKR